MRVRIAERTGSARAALGRLFHVLPQYENMTGTTGTQGSPRTRAPSDLRPPAAQEPPASASGVIRRDEAPLLAHYGTSYGLFDEWIADYACVLVSDAYRLGEYVGDSVWVSGPPERCHRRDARDGGHPPGDAEDEVDALMMRLMRGGC
jgi:hypothetical protein